MRLPIDVATRVSAELSKLIERLVNDPDDDGVLLGEIDELIRRYGAGAPAEPLVRFE
jgi:hypothetical protein